VTDLSIILLNWNGRALLQDCLESIEEQLLRRDEGALEVQTIVVDNGSLDGSVAHARPRFPWAEFVELPRNRGFAAGNNAGIPSARGRNICFLNNDTLLAPGGFEACVRYLDEHPKVGVVGPQLLYPDGRKQNSIHNFPSLLLEVVPRGALEVLCPSRYPSKRFEHTEPLAVEAVLGACMFVRSEVLEQVGGLPEEYFFFLEETDWCFQVRRAGWQVVHHPAAALIHLHGASTKKRVPLATRIEYHRSLYLFFRRNRGEAQERAVRAVRLIKLVLGALLPAPLALVSSSLRERVGQRLGLLRWHLAGRPADWGLSGVRESADREGSEESG
jgi:GT2 family glycosyltransferase